jgi:hypothetical protein
MIALSVVHVLRCCFSLVSLHAHHTPAAMAASSEGMHVLTVLSYSSQCSIR